MDPVNIPNLGRRQAIALRFRDFIKRCSFQFPHVVVIAGNHEFYHGKWKASIQHLRDEYSKFPNVYFLEQDFKVIDDVTFIGGTLWTDCNNGDPLTINALSGMMNDFRVIRNDEKAYIKLKPENTVFRHRQTVGYFKTVLDDRKDSRVVVVGHHAPTFNSVHEKYRNEQLMNGGYASDLSEFILDNPQIVLWTHGHMHDPFDYMIGTTRVVCNPRGYAGHDAQADVFQVKFLEI
jgi:DNA repair exonuclease SbcCD nuclease subunit